MRKFLKIILWSSGSVVILAVGFYVWITQSPWLRHQVESQINRALGVHTDMRISVGGMSGGLFAGVTLTDVVLVVVRDTGSDTLVSVPRVVITYDFRRLLPSERHIRTVEIDQPRVFVPRDSIENVFHKAVQEVSSEAELRGPLQFTIESFSINDGVVLRVGDSLPVFDSLDVLGSYQSGAGRWALDLEPSYAITTWVGPVQFEGKAASTGNSWRFDSLSVKSRRSSMVLRGGLDSLFVRSDSLDLAELSQAINIGLEGRIALSGQINADLDSLRAKGRLEVAGKLAKHSIRELTFRFAADSTGLLFDSLDGHVSGADFRGQGSFLWSAKPARWEYDGSIGGFDLRRFADSALSTSLSGEVEVSGAGTADSTLRLRAELDLGPGHIDSIRIESAAGSIGATAESLVIGEDFVARVMGTTLTGGGTVAFDDSIDVFASFTCPDLRVFDEVIFVDSLAGRLEGEAYLSGLTSDPDLAAFIDSDSLRLFDLRTEQFDARVFVPHFLTDPSGQIDARWGNASTWGIATDSIDLHARLSGRRIDIDSARWYSPQVDVEGAGTLDWSTDTIPIDLFPLTLRWENQTYSASDDIRLTIDKTGFTFRQFQFEGPLGIFQFTGRLGFDQSMALEFELDRFGIAKVWTRFFPRWELDGIMAARGRLRGTFDAPELEMSGDVSDLLFEGEMWGDLEGGISYADRVLNVDYAELDNRYFHATASGAIPMDLRFEQVESRVLDGPLSGRLQVAGDNLDPVSRFLPQTIESVQGDFSLEASVSGTPRKPLFSGEARLSQGTIKAIEIVNPLEDVHIDVALRHDTVIVREAKAVVRDGSNSGNVDAKGMLRLISINSFDYDIGLTGSNVPARMEFKDFFVLSDFDLTVKGITPPKVAGQVRPERVEDREPFTPTEERPLYDPTLWDWDIAIDMPSGGYWIRNEQLEAELSADLRLLRENGVPSYIGSATFMRGKVYLFDKVGRITRGVLIFDDPTKTDPRLDFDVVFRIQQPRVQTQKETAPSPIVDLNLHIGGRASEPLIQPEAPYTEQDVLLLLAAGTTFSTTSDSLVVSDPLTNRLKFAATGLVFSEVQRAAARRLGLETFEINSGNNPFDASITVGRYVSPQLYLYGTSPVDAGAGQEVGFEYRLSRRVFVEGNRDKNNLYRLNLHFNWEY